MPKVSIITTTYNHKDFIAETIESVLSQSYIDWELLIWDDSLNTDTWNVIEKYIDKYPDKIKAWHHSLNKWMIENMKFLLSKISWDSDYVAFLEWDDKFSPDNISEKIAIFDRYENVWVVTSATIFIDWNSDIKKIPNFSTPEWHQKEWIKKWSSIDMISSIETPIRSFGNVMMKKDLLSHILNIDLWQYSTEKMFIPYDFIFWLSIFPKTQVYHTEKKLLKYRFHNHNSSDKKFFKTSLNQMIFICDLYKEKHPKEISYITKLLETKIYALEWNIKASIVGLLHSVFTFPFKNISYKVAIFLDILRIKKIIIKLLFIIWFKQ